MKIAILGFGREGLSAYEYWSKKGNEIVIHDNNEELKIPDGANSVLGPDAFDDLDSYGYDLIVRSPGLRIIVGSLKTPMTTPTNEFLIKCPAKVIGVTGSKGKGTTSTIISKILSAAGFKTHLLGNIGKPALDDLNNINKEDVVIYEMSSFQLYDIKNSPDVAVCLMVTQDHLDWHDDLQEYHESKGNIFNFQTPEDVAVYYSDNLISVNLAKESRAATKYTYGKDSDVSYENGEIIAFGEKIININEIALPGEHNLQNICAAIAACRKFTTNKEAIREVLTTFIGLPYHIELIREKDGIRYYNDSFSTNPTSAIAAARSFTEPEVLFFGGFNKNTDFNELAKELVSKNIRKIITYGQTGELIAETFKKEGIGEVEYIGGSDFNSIISKGISYAKDGDVVVFSPGCASFDMFKDYLDRGNSFNEIINGL